MHEASPIPRHLTAGLLAAAFTACTGSGGGPGGDFGATTAGGIGEPIYRVSTLADSGPGSLREGVSTGRRYVVFDVAGTIALGGNLVFGGSFVTVDGTTAPPPGITLRGAGLRLAGSGVHDVVIRSLRVRSPSRDGIAVRDGAYRVRIENVSVDACGDGNIDITEGARDVTVAWSILSRCAKNVLIKFGAHRVSLHHNLFVGSRHRNPWVSEPSPDVNADVRNNLVWGWASAGTGVECGARANVVANYYSSPREAQRALIVKRCDGGGGDPQVHTAGNLSAQGIPIDGFGNRPAPFAAPPVVTDDACTAASLVLGQAGTFPRDSTDRASLRGIRLAGCAS